MCIPPCPWRSLAWEIKRDIHSAPPPSPPRSRCIIMCNLLANSLMFILLLMVAARAVILFCQLYLHCTVNASSLCGHSLLLLKARTLIWDCHRTSCTGDVCADMIPLEKGKQSSSRGMGLSCKADERLWGIWKAPIGIK